MTKTSVALGLLATLACAATPHDASAQMMRARMPHRMQFTQTAGAYRIELDLLPAEPFTTPADIAAGATSGMVALGGAPPVPPEGMNHHLVVHVYDGKTGVALTHAHVAIVFHHAGQVMSVPITRMEVAGKGPMTTHYGNNVMIPSGAAVVDVTANGAHTAFHIMIPAV